VGQFACQSWQHGDSLLQGSHFTRLYHWTCPHSFGRTLTVIIFTFTVLLFLNFTRRCFILGFVLVQLDLRRAIEMETHEKPVVETIAAEKVSSNEGDIPIEWTDEDEKRIRRRMDVRIVPTVFVLYLLCFIDR